MCHFTTRAFQTASHFAAISYKSLTVVMATTQQSSHHSHMVSTVVFIFSDGSPSRRRSSKRLRSLLYQWTDHKLSATCRKFRVINKLHYLNGTASGSFAPQFKQKDPVTPPRSRIVIYIEPIDFIIRLIKHRSPRKYMDPKVHSLDQFMT